MNKLAKTFLLVILGLWCLKIGVDLLRSPAAQQDFKTYYVAVKAWNAGVNPYSINELSRIAGTKINVPFLYSPVSLLFFEPFVLYSYPTAACIFFLFKAAVLAGLLFLWVKEFLWDQYDIFLFLFCLLAFNCTLYIDFRAGNISVIEQFLLWLGFSFLLKQRWLIFSVFIILAACFKILPIVFLGLLLMVGDRRKIGYLAAGIGIFLAVQAGTYLWMPDLFRDFLRQAGGIGAEYGITNPCLFALIGEGLARVSKNTGVAFPSILPWALYAAAAVGVIGGFKWGVGRIKNRDDRDRFLIFFACLAYALAVCRFKDYSYILLLVPAYYIIRISSFKNTYVLLMILALFSGNQNSLLPWPRVWSYYPLFLAMGVYALYLYEIAIQPRRVKI